MRRLQSDLAWCEAHDVTLAVFPECYLQGYAQGRETLERRALDLQEDAFRHILRALEEFRVTLVLGLVEQASGALYNTAVVICRGRLLGAYRKTHPNERAFTAGTTYPVFDASGLSFGVNICNDANYPDAAAKLREQGAQVLCYPLNNMLPLEIADRWRDRSPDNLVHRARENGCWVVSSDVVGRVDDLVSYGCTAIVNPTGQVVARAAEEREGVAVADLA